jgi:outer membrane protein assembly factor BamB
MSVGAVLSSPAIAGDTIYFGSADGNVYALM